MRKFAVCLILFVLTPAFAASTSAQNAVQPAQSASHTDAAERPAHFYRLDFVLAERDAAGKPVNSRSFSTTVGTAGTRFGSFTVGSKIPIITGADTPKNDSSGLSTKSQHVEPDTQFQYIDIGVKITSSDIHEDGDHLAFNLRAEVSSLATPEVLNGVSEPVIRENVWSGDVLVPVGKPTAIFKSDSLENKGSMELEVTATLVE